MLIPKFCYFIIVQYIAKKFTSSFKAMVAFFKVMVDDFRNTKLFFASVINDDETTSKQKDLFSHYSI